MKKTVVMLFLLFTLSAAAFAVLDGDPPPTCLPIVGCPQAANR